MTSFDLDAQLAFPGAKNVETITEFCECADRAVADPHFFDPSECNTNHQNEGGWIRFPSGLSTEINENNVVWAKLTASGSFDQALVVFHHWNASSRHRLLARFLSRRGITVVEIALPYHFERSRPDAAHADYMLSPNLGRTIQSVRQAVWDGRKLIRCLKSQGYAEVSVLGMSLGSWVAGLVAAHDTNVAKASLFLTAGSLADMVWTGRATRLIRASLEPEIGLLDLNRAWGPLNLENYSCRLARRELDLQVVLAKRDKVVLPELSERFIGRLNGSGVTPDTLRLNCGHYSLALPPYSLIAGSRLMGFLNGVG
ncbi:dienelactone hydrolase-related enzyme [uncultured Paracoccus sp.]|uniref:RcgR family putative quorum lactone hydrolase n=1 Tax=uncultured Paracoccus sp. TaxID=189685 RepID=UPI002633A249|nr:dienelactone hydrolase-related enzyme [uncultured Paracoccus sp.]